MQCYVQLVDILECRLADAYDVRAFVILRQIDKLVPYMAELVLELGQSIMDIEFAK